MSLLTPIFGRNRQPVTRRPARTSRPRWAPTVEGMESRLVMSGAAASLPAVAAAHAVIPTAAPAVQILPLTINNVIQQADGSLAAVGSLGGNTFTAPLALTGGGTTAAGVPVLSLHIDAIDLNLLGLEVTTSPICLDITAQPGGGLLGDLLGGLATGLNSGGTLSGLLGGLSSTDLGQITSGLTSLLNGVLGGLTTTSAAPGAAAPGTQATPSVTGASSDLLHLSLGPVDLNLLGLDVHLDNCNNGPVTVDVIAHENGGLLGDLLFNLNNLLSNGHASNRAISNLLNQVANEINALI